MLGPLAVMALVMHVSARGINRAARRALGNHTYLVVFGGLGTVLHEAFHAAACVVFGHRIVAIKWFDASARDGALGSVTHTYNRNSVYQSVGNFFIGIAPLVCGSVVVYAVARLLAHEALVAPSRDIALSAHDFTSLKAIANLMRALTQSAFAMCLALYNAHQAVGWRIIVFPLLIFSIASSMALSQPICAVRCADLCGSWLWCWR